jgi:hypothetical protein
MSAGKGSVTEYSPKAKMAALGDGVRRARHGAGRDLHGAARRGDEFRRRHQHALLQPQADAFRASVDHRGAHRPQAARRSAVARSDLAPLERIASSLVHHLLYILLLAVALLGWAGVSAYGARDVFGLFSIPPLLPANQALGETILWVHAAAALLMVSLVAAHIGGALMHGFIKHDGVINRMIGWWPLRK